LLKEKISKNPENKGVREILRALVYARSGENKSRKILFTTMKFMIQ